LSRYYPVMIKYAWVILACLVIAAAGGFVLAKSQPPAYQASTTMLVSAGAPGTFWSGGASSSTISDSLSESTAYAAEIPSYPVMSFIIKYDPKIAQRGFTVNDLLADISVLNPSVTAASIQVTAAAPHPADAVLLANDVTNGYIAYKSQQLQDALNTQRTTLQNELTQYQNQSNSLEKQILQIGNTSDPRISLLTADRQSVISIVNTLQTSLVQLPVSVHSDISVIQIAAPGTATPSAKGSEIIAVAAAAGLVLGLLIWLILIFVDNRLRSDDQVGEKLGMSYLGGLTNDKQEIVAGTISTSGPAAQQLADIAVNIHLTGLVSGPMRVPQGAVLLVTSTQAAEGKTTVATGLAAALARSGRSVLVIDGNLRQPATHLAFGASPTGIGLSGLLKAAGSENPGAAVQRTDIPGVWLLAGGKATDEAPLLLEQNLPGVLAQLREKTDWIIIDGPSVLSGADASILAAMVDGVALVVDARNDKLALLLRAKAVLTSLTHTPLGVVINRQWRRKRNAYFAAAYVEEHGVFDAVLAGQGYTNGRGNGVPHGQQVTAGAAATSQNPSNFYGISPSPGRPAPPVPMDFPIMQPNPNPASLFPAPHRLDVIPPQS